MHRKVLLVPVLGTLLLILGCPSDRRVTEVIDGDTFKTNRGETVRLLGINTPEIGDPGGDIARDILGLMILGRKITLQGDVSDTDAYHRILRHVYQDGKNINAELVRRGYAETRFYPPDTAHAAEFRELEKNAVRNRCGLWALVVFQIPDTSATAKGNRPVAPVIGHQDAGKYYNQTMTVQGKIVASHNTGKVCFLNFQKNWRSSFTAVIFAGDFDRFPAAPEDHYLNRKVQITGLIREYRGKPEIIVKNPAQIKILD